MLPKKQKKQRKTIFVFTIKTFYSIGWPTQPITLAHFALCRKGGSASFETVH